MLIVIVAIKQFWEKTIITILFKKRNSACKYKNINLKTLEELTIIRIY